MKKEEYEFKLRTERDEKYIFEFESTFKLAEEVSHEINQLKESKNKLNLNILLTLFFSYATLGVTAYIYLKDKNSINHIIILSSVILGIVSILFSLDSFKKMLRLNRLIKNESRILNNLIISNSELLEHLNLDHISKQMFKIRLQRLSFHCDERITEKLFNNFYDI